jgi:nicotinamide-nucleotide amidase
LAVVSYSNAMKQRILGVPEAVLVEHGAVSGACVEAMLSGVRSVSGAELCAAVSGIAGPGGGDAHKPVGTVWIAVSRRDQHWVTRRVFAGDRAGVRRAASAEVFEGLNRLVEGQNPW